MNKQKLLLSSLGVLFLGLPLYMTSCVHSSPSGAWLTGDLHNHTFLTDGHKTMTEVIDQGFHFGLDWIANSEHGGAFGRTTEGQPWPQDIDFRGKPPQSKMWRWQSLWQSSFPLLNKIRSSHPNKIILQGYEWNVPSHDHASVGIVGTDEDNGRSIARHEYLFDAEDSDTSSDNILSVSGKITLNDHHKALAGVDWLAQHYPTSSYFIINHPSRQLQYSITDIRDFNDLAPQVAFGFEGIPGHQKAASRGGYNNGPFRNDQGEEITFKARTYGGADHMLGKIGGTWDALLGEGRRFFTFVNSDFHQPNYDFWPGEYAKNYIYVRDSDHDGTHAALELLEGMRSGNAYVVLGDLVNGLEFSANNGRHTTSMGGEIDVAEGAGVEIRIRFRCPQSNNNGQPVSVNHIDLIAGEVHGKKKKYLADGHTVNPAYGKDTNETTRMIARFTKNDWHEEHGGWKNVTYQLPNVKNDLYLRLRGTNLECGVPGETDADCNPLNDESTSPNSTNKAYQDLWFYSNPLFITLPR